eukprot:scaffold539_cov359-Prasinococcus_capsulatus_cf.AAC.18
MPAPVGQWVAAGRAARYSILTAQRNASYDLQGVKIVPALVSISVGLVLNFVVPVPAGVSPQAWQLLSIFLSTIVGLVLSPLPVGAWAFCALTVCIATKVGRSRSQARDCPARVGGLGHRLLMLSAPTGIGDGRFVHVVCRR